MSEQEPIQFDPASFLASTGLGRRVVQLKPKQAFFSQGNPADCIFYLQKGRAKLTVVSTNGKEAKKPRSHFLAPATSLEKNRTQGRLGCAWRLPLRLLPVQRSRSRDGR